MSPISRFKIIRCSTIFSPSLSCFALSGKRPVGQTVFPQPVFMQDIAGKTVTRAVPSVSATLNRVMGNSPDSPDISPVQHIENNGHSKLDDTTLPPSNMMLSMGKISGQSFLSDLPKTPLPAAARPTAILTTVDPKAFFTAARAAEEQPAAFLESTMETGPVGGETPASARRSELTQQLVMAASFNGIGKCAVFPVPISSLAISVWASILDSSSADLTVNPFGVIRLPISELLELTLPPVDASCMSPWPKPLQYYSNNLN